MKKDELRRERKFWNTNIAKNTGKKKHERHERKEKREINEWFEVT
jgi:hypothetical protein